MSTIIVTHEDHEVDEFDFPTDRDIITIGRRSSNDVCVPNLSVSGKHARITIEDGEAWIEDLNSTNGTYINGRLIARQILQHKDEIIMGKVRLQYVSDEAADKDSRIADAASTDARSEVASDEVAKSALAAGAVAASAVGARASAHIEAAAPGAASERSRDESLAHEPAPVDYDNSDIDEQAMSLSDKARVALGREPAERPTLQAVNANTGTAGLSAEIDSNAAVAEAPVLRKEVPAAASKPASTNAHPLEGISNDDIQQPMHELDSPATPSRGAVIEIKNGAKSGQILPIDKPVTTLGRPGIQIAAIMRKPDGYFLMHIESDDSVDRPTLNRDAIGDEPVLLHSGDELNVAGIDVEFMLS